MDKQPFLLDNTIQHYAWGSRSAIASLQGRLPAQRPEAELWIGAHANASSLRRATGESLFQLISDDPASALGHRTRTAFGDSLPKHWRYQRRLINSLIRSRIIVRLLLPSKEQVFSPQLMQKLYTIKH